MRICVIGSGYVGLVAGACFAELGHNVILVDNDPAKYDALNRGDVPIHEEHLPELLARHRSVRLTFSTCTADAVKASQAVFVAVGTPPTTNGEADLSYVESVARDVAGAVSGYQVIVDKSTVPVYTSEWVRKIMLLEGAPADSFDVVSNPEFLREGTAVSDFLYPDRIVIGADNQRSAKLLEEIYQPLIDGTYYERQDAIPSPPGFHGPATVIKTSSRSAELIKHASNAFLAMKISFINAVANICEAVGADVEEVREGVGSDSRIGARFLSPGIGYGGSCFPKDVAAFSAIAEEGGVKFGLLNEVMQINDNQSLRFIRKVRNALWTLKRKRLGVLGLAFKEGTDDIRESPAISIIQALLKEDCRITAYDPAAMTNAAALLGEKVRMAETPYEVADGSDALLILTEWSTFKSLDFTHIRKLLRYPIVIDGRNLLSPEEMQRQGLIYLSIGRPDVIAAGQQARFAASAAREDVSEEQRFAVPKAQVRPRGKHYVFSS